MQSSSAQLEHGEAGNTSQHPPKGDGYRIERTVWIVMLVLPLVAYCVVAILTFSIKTTPINTGDALYDKYLAWVADNLGSRENSDYYSGYLQGWDSSDDGETLDPFADWEAEFRDDPRYWMLRYRYANTPWAPWQGDGGHLESAWVSGVADGAIFLIMLNELDSNYWGNYDFTPSELGFNSQVQQMV